MLEMRPDCERCGTDLPAQNTTLTGAQLMAGGLPVTFNGTTQSEIILIDNL